MPGSVTPCAPVVPSLPSVQGGGQTLRFRIDL